MNKELLEVKNLKTFFPIKKGIFFPKTVGNVQAVNDVSLTLSQGEVLGLVGESGCGKTTLGRSIMRLVNSTSGTIQLDGVEIQSLEEKELRKYRPGFQMIFQDPYASLDPRMTVFDALAEPLLAHSSRNIGEKHDSIEQRVSELMKQVGLSPRFVRKYPHEFSGGQRQRIAIARALALKPKLIIADEPVSALDVSIQSQILNLLMELRRQYQLTMIFISHDLSVVRYISDRVAVMYLGKIVEIGTSEEIFNHPKHPYTQALISAIPRPDPKHEKERKRVLLEGDPPSPINPPSGCFFHPRCPYAAPACSQTSPQLERGVACIRVGEF
jgi:oligopeptide transport system ATP-binding protein